MPSSPLRIDVRVEAREHTTAGVQRLTLVSARTLPAWQAGQYCYCLDGAARDPVRVPFSIASAPPVGTDRRRLALHYQPTPDHPESRLMDALLDRGSLTVELPHGTAVPDADDGVGGWLWLIGFGTGIAPMTAIAEDLARRRQPRQVLLAWGLARPDRDYLGGDFDRLATGPGARTLRRISDDDPAGPLVHTLTDWLGTASFGPVDRVLLAGGYPAVQAAAATLTAAGLPRERLRSDMLDAG